MHLKQSDKKRLEQYIEAIRKDHHNPGLAIAITKGDQLVYARGFGHKDMEGKAPVTPDTMFGIASITKTFTAAAVMKLIEEKKLNLEDPVTRHISDFTISGENADHMTIARMLTHTTGLPPLRAMFHAIRDNTPEDPTNPAKDDEKTIAVNTTADLIDYIATRDIGLFSTSGIYTSYSNDCYALLGEIIEKTSGMPYDDYIEKTFLKPLGMKRSTFDLKTLLEQDDVTGLFYTDADEKLKQAKYWQEAPPYLPGGWLKSSATELVRFYQMLALKGKRSNTRFLDETSVDAMLAPEAKGRWTLNSHYCLGLCVRTNHYGVTLAEHGGSLTGVASQAGFVPEEDIAVAVLTNLKGFPANRIWQGAVNVMLGLSPYAKVIHYTERNWSQTIKERRTGTFTSSEGAKARFFMDGDTLACELDGKTYPVTPVTDNVAVVRANGRETEAWFLEDDDQSLWGVGFGSRILKRVKDV